MQTVSTPNVRSTEVPPRPRRRTFTKEYKLRVVREADAAAATPGAVGALLRREGIYSSHLAAWRRELRSGGPGALEPKRRGRKPRRTGEEEAMQKLERENERLRKRLDLSEALVELQKKVLTILDSPPPETPSKGSAR